MNLIRTAIEKPVTASVGVILLVMFGLIALNQLPVQLTPDVESPVISVRTYWNGATPLEVETEIVDRQEEALKSLSGLVKMESSSYNNFGDIDLEFQIGIDIDDALLRVSNKLNEVRSYPDGAERPVINSSGARADVIIWMMLKSEDPEANPVGKYRSFFENNVRQHLERVDGVGSLFVFGGTEEQLEIALDVPRMAAQRIGFPQVTQAIQSANQNISAGVLGVANSNYRVRTLGQFQDPEDPLDVILEDDGLRRVQLGSLASTQIGYEEQYTSVMHNDKPVIVIGIRREQGANVIDLTSRVREVVDELNQRVLPEKDIYIEWVYDQTPYINRAIDQVKTNIALGGTLAIGVLLLFLRSFSSTIAVATAIPISAIGTFIFLWILDRNINVVSLAGISFAIGMLVDSAIVVLDNIDRLRRNGLSAYEASYQGANQVWGAIFASASTTVAVFLPIIFMQQEAGQLFRDIAIAITSAIVLSLIVSITVIPTITNQLYGTRAKKTGNSIIDRFGSLLHRSLMRLSGLSLHSTFSRAMTVVVLISGAIYLSSALLPKAEYLPQGNRNLILNILIPPPGLSHEKREALGHQVFAEAQPYYGEPGDPDREGFPPIKDMFFVSGDFISLFGAISTEETRAAELIPLFTRIIGDMTDMFGVSLQAGIFQQGLGKGRSIDLNVSGEDLDKILNANRAMYGQLKGMMPEAQIRPLPSLENSYPEINVVPDKSALLANGMREQDLGAVLDTLMLGRRIGDYQPSGEPSIDLILTAANSRIQTPEELMEQVIVNGHGELVRIGELASLEYSQGMTQINRLEKRRTIGLQITPPKNLPLEQAMEIIEKELLPPMQSSGVLDGLSVSLGGTADKLSETMQALKWNFLLVIAITYLLLAALFESFVYPLVIMFTVPLAALGGFIGIQAISATIAPQPLDILAMLGFIILVGTVVNNAILLVYQTLQNMREELLAPTSALKQAVATRIRPIYMSTLTSVLGLMPLVLTTEAGSELYRGIGAVTLGGLLISSIFTLFLTPALLSFFLGIEQRKINRRQT